MAKKPCLNWSKEVQFWLFVETPADKEQESLKTERSWIWQLFKFFSKFQIKEWWRKEQFDYFEMHTHTLDLQMTLQYGVASVRIKMSTYTQYHSSLYQKRTGR